MTEQGKPSGEESRNKIERRTGEPRNLFVEKDAVGNVVEGRFLIPITENTSIGITVRSDLINDIATLLPQLGSILFEFAQQLRQREGLSPDIPDKQIDPGPQE